MRALTQTFLSLIVILTAIICLLLLITTTDETALGKDRVYKKPLSKLTQTQLEREKIHAQLYVRFIRRHPIARYHRAFLHRSCFSVERGRRGLCFYVRNRLRDREGLLARIERLLAPVLPAHYNEWLCIHGYEGAWNANTGNGFYGGLQMDWSFMQSYGSTLLKAKGTANNWTPLEQMWVAERAYASGRGFGPWPNTARYCGLM